MLNKMSLTSLVGIYCHSLILSTRIRQTFYRSLLQKEKEGFRNLSTILYDKQFE